ncbi:DUF4124 domain-containing protein [Aromatoleum diolicum]|uniref:DUF4124 domain-containing protein n=1 Tax=Aromatoleum diolicum TaxID=75796 RepID=A0ABX1QCS4_9RHOO|nr:DUF4124 domain-containing protein [Aromatoleum diolicum]NMG75320.1 hypothetical protein [Aromatoleum diolicum]
MASRRSIELLCVVALSLPLADASARIYCCDDANGRRVCGDVLPAACYESAYREMGPQGTIKRQIAAPLSAEEIARRKADEQRRKDEEVQQVKQRRLDQALLETYGSVEDIDRRRDREIAEIERSLAEAREREAELRTKRKRLEQDAEFYKGRQIPRELSTSLRAIDSELATFGTIFETKARDIEAARARFAADRARYAELIRAGANTGRAPR